MSPNHPPPPLPPDAGNPILPVLPKKLLNQSSMSLSHELNS
ncbi:MAG TPA: hypothetical protein VHJ38_01030 [Nitrososphaeraceae archaeon]|nr:hypothetical protein [Nitrososphaeraceae archaeon]